MHAHFTLRQIFAGTALAGGMAAAFVRPEGILWLAIVLLALIALWPWMFGHGG